MNIAAQFAQWVDATAAPTALLAVAIALGSVALVMFVGGMLDREPEFSTPGAMLVVSALCALYLAGKVGG